MRSFGRIMIVDDDPDILATFEMALTDAGFSNIDTFADPKKALEHFKSGSQSTKENYDLVISDVRMPGMSGIEFAIELLKIRPDQKIVFMSAFDQQSIHIQIPSVSSREWKCLQKPIAISDLLKVSGEDGLIH